MFHIHLYLNVKDMMSGKIRRDAFGIIKVLNPYFYSSRSSGVFFRE